MRIFNQEKTQELFDVDETKGVFKKDKLFLRHVEKVEEKSHLKVVKTYANGGKDVEKVVDVVGTEEHDEFEDILVFVPFSEKELAQIEIEKLKQNLLETDYKAIKFAEGVLSEQDYEKTRNERQSWRNQINALQKQL